MHVSEWFELFGELMCIRREADLNAGQPFGVSYSGASFKYTVLDTSGRRSAAQGKRVRIPTRMR